MKKERQKADAPHQSAADEGQVATFVYIALCSDGTYYTGTTPDLERRLRQHNGEIAGGAKYTRARRPVTFCHVEKYADARSALAREHEIKNLTRGEKEGLVLGLEHKK